MSLVSCSNKGSNWERIEDGSYYSVFALDANNVWVGGHEGVVVHYDGASWSQQGSVGYFLNDIAASGPDEIWGTDFYGGVYRFNGSNWDVDFETTDRLHCITALDDHNVWTGSEEGSIYRYDGSAWNKEAELGEAILDIDAIDPYHVWAVGGLYFASEDNTRMVGPGHVYFYDGKTWSEIYEAEELLLGVSALDERCVWAVGDEGTALFFDGNEWARSNTQTSQLMWAVTAADTEHVWAITSDKILAYDGSDWRTEEQFRLGKEEEGIIELRDISAAYKESAWAVGSDGIYCLDSE